MQCLTMTLMLLCATLLSSCATNTVTDSFCAVYQPVITKGDSVQAPQGVKRRLLANELTYKDQCK